MLALRRSGRIGPDRVLTLFGPALMIKTQRGRKFLDRVGRYRRFWSVVGDIGLILAAVAMVVIVALLVFDAVAVTQVPTANRASPQQALGIPGINPVIPIGYGLVALVVGIVLHELMHGVLARSQNVGVKSLGVLWLVVPIGAFVEQDDAEVAQAPRRTRNRIAAAGVLANFVLTVIFFAAIASIVSTAVQPNANGVGVAYVLPGFPAQNASLRAGDIITAVNGTVTPTNGALHDALGKTVPGETVPIAFYNPSTSTIDRTSATLAPLSAYTNQSSDANRSFLGVSLTILTPAQLLHELSSPLTTPLGPLGGAATWLILPLAGLEPVTGSTQAFYHVTGVFAGIDPTAFWVGVNVLYWLAWMNLLLGLSNSLPLIPFDGGVLFRNFAASLLRRVRTSWDSARLDQAAGRLTIVASVVVAGLIVWQFVAPRL